MPLNKYSAVSFFTCAGLGDLGLSSSGANFIAMNEIEADRAGIARTNFPKTRIYDEPIEECWKELVSYTKKKIKSDDGELFLATCTAPCQGMSSAGMGKLLDEVKRGNRPELDPRNALILPALEAIRSLKPRWVLFENVTAMRRTLIDYEGKLTPILDVIDDMLGPKYEGEAYDVEFANYGIPQKRKRLITVYTRDPKGIELLRSGGQLIPKASHSKNGEKGLRRWVSVGEALKSFPTLDAGSKETAQSEIPLHYVAVLDEKKYFWVSNTPPGQGAFDNQCVNPDCCYQGNQLHTASRGRDGVNRSSRETPLYCEKCGALLPRPYVENPDGTKRIMRGFTSAYRRMKAATPSPTLSRNFTFVCGDHKIHYSQNRPLTIAEALHLQTVDEYSFDWIVTDDDQKHKRAASPSLIRLCISESIPPYFMELLGNYIKGISNCGDTRKLVDGQLRLIP